MKAVVFEGKGSMNVRTLPDPKVSDGHVVVRPLVSAVCLTDVASYDGIWEPALPGIAIGHEASAEIVAVGRDVVGWQVGDRVAVEPTEFCGECDNCVIGLYEACTTINNPKQSLGINSQFADGSPRHHGLLAEYCSVPKGMLYRVPDNVSDVEAASIEVLAVKYPRLRDSLMRVGDDVVIFGADFDMYCLALLVRLSAARVVIVEPNPLRRSVARKKFEHVIDPDDVDVNDYVRALMPEGADVVYAGADTLDLAASLLRVNGTLSLSYFGSYKPRELDRLMLSQQRIRPQSLPNGAHLAPTFAGHTHEKWKGGQRRHSYDVIAQMLEREMVSTADVYELIPGDEMKSLIERFPTYHDSTFRVALRF